MGVYMRQKIKILYIAAEITPYANAGGLGEVGRSLPQAFAKEEGFEVRRVMPLYKNINREMKYVTDFPVPMDQGFETCIVKTLIDKTDILTYFIQNDRYFYRDNIYGYDDDGFRFFFYCRAVVEMLKRIAYKPDIVQINDWHTGFIVVLLKKEFPDIKTVFTIHNISYHGFIPASYLSGLLNEEEQDSLGYPEWLNFMKAGIRYADLVTTVSPGYANEIQLPDNSCGMSELVSRRKNGIIGILNGIDTDSYNPGNDGILEFPYDINSIEQKKKNRTDLRKEYDLPDSEKPLLAMVTRLDYYKGIDILLKAVSYLDLSKFQLIVLGSGNSYYQGMLSCIAAAYPGIIAVNFQYTPELARRIYAASDIYLMPSLYEPCGLGQLYAMRYGAVPVVNPVGGLKDTVTDDSNPEKATGFFMEDWSGEALCHAIRRAVDTYHQPVWEQYIRNAMQYDSSWKSSVLQYRKAFEELLKS
jgi:starch synthase